MIQIDSLINKIIFNNSPNILIFEIFLKLYRVSIWLISLTNSNFLAKGYLLLIILFVITDKVFIINN